MNEQTSSATFSQAQPLITKKQQQKKSSNSKNQSKINKNFFERTITTILMLAIFLVILLGGQTYCLFLVMFVVTVIFKQVSYLKRNQQKQSQLPLTGILNWYIFFVTNYYALGVFIDSKFPNLILQHPNLRLLLKYHHIITCILSIIGLISFVLTLNKRYLKYQFRLFGWISLASIIVVYPTYFIMHNCVQGLFWFIMPSILIVVNDIFAYLFGYFFGKNKLIEISPKKTWQGYIGGALSTMFFAVLLTTLLQKIPGITCVLTRPTLEFMYLPDCAQPLFQSINLGFLPFEISKLSAHMIIIGIFASLIGPFGGFFASGLKRSIKIKDFSDTIPGHGGFSDRMDCQIILGIFTYFYLHNIVRLNSYILNYWVYTMDTQEKLQFYYALQKHIQTIPNL